ncbi:MAG: radical SAM protein [Nitrososphaerota archaeon]|nr:radical SAM protein [Candidatus Bathyarchaeota archaeon]MDW8023646.1 radical SAM protein [Nitrososphaerota archaeon]
MGMLRGKLEAPPTTAYIMTYREGKCLANCGFCPQARQSRSRADMLSRVTWPPFPTHEVLSRIREAAEKGLIRRVCIQALNYPEVFSHLKTLIEALSQQPRVPVSVSCQPLNMENIRLLAEAGAERIGIPIDAATEEIFDRVKGAHAGGPYQMKRQFALLEEAVKIFGKGKVSTHLIVGLGETEREMAQMIQKCVDMGVLPALFAFTPIAGTALENHKQPPIQQYRRVQLARHLIFHGISRFENMRFDSEGRIISFGAEEQALRQILQSGKPFQTSGCPDCNRPYYNEKPGGPLYNYPKPLNVEDLRKTAGELGRPALI